MNRIKKFLLLAMALTVLLCCGVTAYAEDGEAPGEQPGSSVSDAVVFKNIKAADAGLIVRKEVVNTEGDVSQDVFLFRLLLEGAVAKDQPYKYYNKDGVELVRYMDLSTGQEGQVTRGGFDALVAEGNNLQEMAFKTDSFYGTFTLKDGETAVFISLEEGIPYTVSEVQLPEGYKQVYPAIQQEKPESGSYSGEVKKDDTDVKLFQNQKIVEPTEPGGDGELRNITVTKNLAGKEGYQQPKTDAVFRFRVERITRDADGTEAGEPLAKRSYAVVNAADKSNIGPRDMEEDGIITLHPGEMAILEDLPRYQKYRVEEILEENDPWWLDGDQPVPFTLMDTTDLEFTNRNASFAVLKKMEDGSVPEEDFVFYLKDGDNTAWSGALYYLYDSNTKLLLDTQPHVTTAEGAFTLRASQTAFFTGIAPGTAFSVEEKTKPGYAPVEGYTGETVQAIPQELVFTNRVQENTASLTVRKRVVSDTERVDDKTEFWFRLTQVPANGEPENVSGKSYMVGSERRTLEEDGLFCLMAGQEANFQLLSPGKNYRAEELGIRIENEDGSVTYSLEGYTTTPAVFQDRYVGDDGAEPMEFVNYYKSTGSLKLIKVDKEDNSIRLNGAEFTLTKLDASGAVDKAFEPLTLTTKLIGEENGIALEQDELVSGIYRLEETKAPEGYLAMKEPVLLEISLKNKEVTITNPNADQVEGTVTVDGQEKTVEITVQNGFYRLPKTGGPGTEAYTAVGLTLLLGTAMVWYDRRRRIS